jgi:hypothetical protein
VLQKIFDILTGGTNAAFTINRGKWRHTGYGSPAFARLAAALVVRARRRLGDRDRVGTGKGILEPKIQRILEQLLVARLLLASAPDVRLVLEVIILGRVGSVPVLVHFFVLPYADGRNSAALAVSRLG